jgi:hypothetical protein
MKWNLGRNSARVEIPMKTTTRSHQLSPDEYSDQCPELKRLSPNPPKNKGFGA